MKMNRVIFAAVAMAAVLTTGALAQPVAPVSAPNEIIYLPQLPTVTDLVNAARAQGLSVARIDQTSNSVTVVTTAANGQTATVLYLPISSAGSAPGAVPQPSTPAPAVSMANTMAVYDTPAYNPYGYYDYPYDYYPWWGWPVGVGFGWGYYGGRGYGGFRGGGFHGSGFHGSGFHGGGGSHR
jgi:uncharacterized membrane protein YgcG